ncbi:M23 family metallopeptidase [Halalkalibacter sp. APA_J-10(15)]|uniref:M23 family metallopeptidase n=1 Tax=Halalkalibacter sp. APA_J-10(15) TaxID=2933805 RepID=UPI001FF18856|nr:M23 family metallopeptidase [Halalkalibacter sp. APA_J-10(15)]MCK0471386.1 M23 family metallopeptidase [Halalkalibacter sp. APA_J-10(15)]
MSTFIWPTDTKRITSGFRTSSRPDHHGIDIAEAGVRTIFAVANGTISRSYVSDSYGEVIFITHQINGQTWETVYAHLRTGSRGFSVGQTVRQGQQIGIMGNTGRSFGQHLHFELHRGRWNIEKSNAVNPVDFLEKNLTPPTVANLNEDGKWGNQTTRALQEHLATVVDGYLSNQSRNSITQALYGTTVQFGTGGSLVIRALQRKLKVKDDGLLGPITVRALQKNLGTVQDGKLSRPSMVVRELQRQLNNGTF